VYNQQWVIGYITTVCYLDLLFRVELLQGMITFGELEGVWWWKRSWFITSPISQSSHECYMFCPPNLSWFNLRNCSVWWLQLTKLVIMQFSPVTCFIISRKCLHVLRYVLKWRPVQCLHFSIKRKMLSRWADISWQFLYICEKERERERAVIAQSV